MLRAGPCTILLLLCAVAVHAYRNPLGRHLLAECVPTGGAESPINLSKTLPGGVPELTQRFTVAWGRRMMKMADKPGALEFEAGNEAATFYDNDGKPFTATLAQIHFHGPAEHELDGQKFDLELHMVFVADGKPRAVIGVLYRLGQENQALEDIVEAIENGKAEADVDFNTLFPGGSYFTYDGGLTAPSPAPGLACMPGQIRWQVMTSVQTVSQEQLDSMKTKWTVDGKADNHREVQPIVKGNNVKFVN